MDKIKKSLQSWNVDYIGLGGLLGFLALFLLVYFLRGSEDLSKVNKEEF